MKRVLENIAALACAALVIGYTPLLAQKPKSEKERQAIVAVQQATTPEARIDAIENVLTKFADTEFKVPLLQMAVQMEQQKNDFAQTVFYCERLLKADPNNAFALVTLASETARHTREFDLDKDEKLKKVDAWAKQAIEVSKTMPKVRADVTDADWEGFKKDMQAQAYEALGMADTVRKNYEGAEANYRQALATASTPNPATLVRLAQVYFVSGKLDNASYTLDKAINTPNVPEQVKTVAESMKNEITKRKADAAAKPAAPAPAPPATTPANKQP